MFCVFCRLYSLASSSDRFSGIQLILLQIFLYVQGAGCTLVKTLSCQLGTTITLVPLGRSICKFVIDQTFQSEGTSSSLFLDILTSSSFSLSRTQKRLCRVVSFSLISLLMPAAYSYNSLIFSWVSSLLGACFSDSTSLLSLQVQSCLCFRNGGQQTSLRGSCAADTCTGRCPFGPPTLKAQQAQLGSLTNQAFVELLQCSGLPRICLTSVDLERSEMECSTMLLLNLDSRQMVQAQQEGMPMARMLTKNSPLPRKNQSLRITSQNQQQLKY